jgi:hypothetical protein
LENVKKFWKKSYTSDPVAFGFELTSFIFTVAASLYLAMTADAPDMRYVYPGFMIGAVAGAYAYLRRGLAWPLLLTSYFTLVNIFGFGVATGWW